MVTVKQKFPQLPDGTIDIDAWLDKLKVKHHIDDASYALIKQSYEVALRTSKGLTTFYGLPCIEQSLEMAEILLALNLDAIGISAGMLKPAFQCNTSVDPFIATEKLNPKIPELITHAQLLNIFDHLKSDQKSQQQIDKIRKTLLAMVSDIRAVLIKLAERTCLMRGIKKINSDERKRIAKETMNIYAPLANRLGIGQLKWELEDIGFHYTHPVTYKKIASFLAERRITRELRIQNFIEELKTELNKLNINYKISGRAKHIYSIYLKMIRKNVNFDNIYDYSAIRILVDTESDCYNTLSLIHSNFEHIPEEFDDYIAHPKANGYRSIHTAVIGPDGKNLEIQIRTFKMHEESERGVSAHWIYKEKTKLEDSYADKVNYLHQLLHWQKDIIATDLKSALLEDRIYAFTPRGDIFDLPKNSTPLDFAYNLHTEIGHRCRGAKVNGHIVPLSYHLQTGDKVEIITSAQGTPSRDWLSKESGYLNTQRARAKVAQWFRKIDSEREVPVTPNIPKAKPVESPALTAPKWHYPDSQMQIAGIDDVLTRIAKCCKPIPGDKIIGFITQGKGVSIHRSDCKNILLLEIVNQPKLVEVTWNASNSGAFYVDLKIYAHDNEHLLKDISSSLAHFKIELVALNSFKDKTNQLITIKLTIKISELDQLKTLIPYLKQFNNVKEVIRV